MDIADHIEEMKANYPAKASDAFREQLERFRRSCEEMDGQVAPLKGIDRSGELTPVERPVIVRTLVDAA